MENASKALIMAASVLLGVMIISVGVALFNSFSSFGADAAKKIEEKQISEWNNNYLKYYGNTTYLKDENDKNKGTINAPIKVTAHDIISIINSASQNNIKHFGDYTNEWVNTYSGNENYYYIRIDVPSANNAETWNDTQKIKFLSENANNYYKVAQEPKISSVTKRVMHMKFVNY